jgi:ABC-type uncharacterized transport system auxiliary subunit
MRKYVAAALGLALLGGCIGKPGPVEEYLRVGGAEPCPQQSASQAQQGERLVVAVRPFKAADSIDRQAVMVARGRVATPSLRWYWEASPAKLFEQAVARGVDCAPGLAAAWPVRASTEAGVALTGTVTMFELQESPLVLNAAGACQLWDREGVKLLASRRFSASVPVKSFDAQAIAEAAAQALSSMGAEAGAWLSDNRPIIAGKSK